MSKRPQDTRTGINLVPSSTEITTAVSQLVEANLRLVVSYAQRFRKCGPSLVDLIHAGNLGLVEAARTFDASRDTTFVGYASWWVRQAMIHAIADHTGQHPMASSVVATPVVDQIVPAVSDQSDDDELLREFDEALDDVDVDVDLDDTFQDIQLRASSSPRAAERLRSHLN